MSTRINITVDSDILLERNRQQVDVNRLKFLTDAAREDAAQEGVDRLNQDLIAAGIDPETRRPLDTSAIDPRPNFEEPGALRTGDGVLLVPRNPYKDFGGTLSGIFGISGAGRVLFSRFFYEDTTEYDFGQFSPELRFAPGEGPSGANALALDLASPFEDIGTFTDYSQGQTFDPENAVFVPLPLPSGVWYNTFVTPVGNLQTMPAPVQRAGLQYAKTPVRYDGLSSNLVDFDSAGPYLYKRLDGEIDELRFNKRAIDYRNVTHEFYIRFTDNTDKLGETRIRLGHAQTTLLETRRVAQCTVLVDGISIRLEVEEERTTVLNTAVAAGAGQFNVSDDVINNLLTLNIIVTSRATDQQGTAVYVASSSSTNRFNHPRDENIAPLEGDEWCHCALVRTYDNAIEKSVWAFYWRGIRLFTATESDTWETTNALAPIGARILIQSNRGQFAPAEYLLPAIHGYRFTPRALYSGETFTPPEKILRLV